MSFWNELAKLQAKAHDALAVAKPVVAAAATSLQPLEHAPGIVGQGAIIAEQGVAVLSVLIAEFESLLAALPVQPTSVVVSAPPPPAAV